MNVNNIHHCEFSNRVLMPFPGISMHVVNSKRVSNMITNNKRGFFTVAKSWCHFPEFIKVPAARCFNVNFKETAREGNNHCCHCTVSVHLMHHSEFSNRLQMPFPRIFIHAVNSQRVCTRLSSKRRAICHFLGSPLFVLFEMLRSWLTFWQSLKSSNPV